MVSGGYAGGRVASTASLTLTCGENDWKAMLEEYDIIFHIGETVQEYIKRATLNEHPLQNFPEIATPDALAFTVDDFANMLTTHIGCALGESQSTALQMHTEKMLDALHKRIGMTRRLLYRIDSDYSSYLAFNTQRHI